MVNARDFYDPSIQQAEFVAARVANLSEDDVITNGGKKIAQWTFTLDAQAQLKTLERLVKEKSLGKFSNSL